MSMQVSKKSVGPQVQKISHVQVYDHENRIKATKTKPYICASLMNIKPLFQEICSIGKIYLLELGR